MKIMFLEHTKKRGNFKKKCLLHVRNTKYNTFSQATGANCETPFSGFLRILPDNVHFGSNQFFGANNQETPC